MNDPPTALVGFNVAETIGRPSMNDPPTALVELSAIALTDVSFPFSAACLV